MFVTQFVWITIYHIHESMPNLFIHVLTLVRCKMHNDLNG